MTATHAKPRIALVSREVAPFGGGGIGIYVAALAQVLAADFEPTIFTTSRHERAYRRARRKAPESLPRAPLRFVSEPRVWDARRAFSVLHEWSARVHAALLDEYAGTGPELIEFCDFLGEGCVTLQAKRTGSPALRDTRIAVRLHGTAEIYDVLDGYLPSERQRTFTHELERYALRYADELLWAGGDVLGTYERFYGAAELAPARRVRHPLPRELAGEPQREQRTGALHLLYLGRLERRKGVRTLLDALFGLEHHEWHLTVAGTDTATAPLGGSMRDLLELEVAGDPRIRMLDAVPAGDVDALIDANDVLVVPSRWECWPYVALEAVARGRPVLSTPTGGMTEIVAPEVSGWLAADTSAEALGRALAPLVERPALARDGIDPAKARELCAELTDPEAIRDAYGELCQPAVALREAAPASEAPLVSIVIPYFQSERHLELTLASVAAQTHPRVEVIVVNDGSLRPQDGALPELAQRYGAAVVTQQNSGLGAARNLGIQLARGDYVLPLDADNLIAAGFVARCVAALEADPEIAFVTSWLRYIDDEGRPWKGTEEGLMAIGNSSRVVDSLNVAGDAVAVFRRELFEAGLAYSTDVVGFEDWVLYRELRDRGLVGHAIPEPLISYRLRDDSMMRSLTDDHERWARRAIEAHLRERRVTWTAPGSESRSA